MEASSQNGPHRPRIPSMARCLTGSNGGISPHPVVSCPGPIDRGGDFSPRGPRRTRAPPRSLSLGKTEVTHGEDKSGVHLPLLILPPRIGRRTDSRRGTTSRDSTAIRLSAWRRFAPETDTVVSFSRPQLSKRGTDNRSSGMERTAICRDRRPRTALRIVG